MKGIVKLGDKVIGVAELTLDTIDCPINDLKIGEVSIGGTISDIYFEEPTFSIEIHLVDHTIKLTEVTIRKDEYKAEKISFHLKEEE